ncbi:hypothetical protein M8C21_017133 [Ambrosia artemisiifolia]|uniref:Brix domain-containing protein n=1 Tax=Ambrosia artemisiifolia TaxID=4212 RepID=A0AAD5DCL7_AMBAR|nr:hypothetical protein M8C21_017133 [Ambrosia artemisiifolia]
MGKKRKHSEAEAPAVKKEETAPERPKRTLLGWKEDNPQQQQSITGFRNREKVLVTCSRRINYSKVVELMVVNVFRYRHLMLNLVSVLPHCKKDNKVESKATKGATLNELVELKSCSSCLFFECRKHKDLYLWMSKCPNGPSVKFLVNAVHTMEELKLTGNHLKGSRPLLTFSSNFDKDPHWKLLKEMITQNMASELTISCPHTGADKIDRGGLEKMTLIEVGPRFCLNPIKIFGGSFGGPTLYENPFYVSPNQIRSLEKRQKAGKYAKKVKAKTRRKMHEMTNPLEADEFADMWKE